MVYKMLKNPFYYGEFEYPKDSGNWYKGKHPKMIDKDLYDRVQIKLQVPQKAKWGSKKFPYKNAIKCGSCNSSISGNVRMKDLKNGKKSKHIYYLCGQQKDYYCKEPYIKEEQALDKILNNIDLIVSRLDFIDKNFQKDIDSYSSIVRSSDPNLNDKQCFKKFIEYTLLGSDHAKKVELVSRLNINMTLKNKVLELH